MQFGRRGKKADANDSSRVEDDNTSNYSGINQDSFSRGREANARGLNMSSHPRGEVFDKSTTESGFKEVYFYDPSEMRRTQYMSPNYTEGRQTIGNQYMANRSPPQTGVRQSVLNSVRQDLNNRDDTANILGKKPIPSLVLNIPRRENVDAFEKYERSPKVISLAGNDQPDYNTKSYSNQRRSPRETNRPLQSTNYMTNSLNFGDNLGNTATDQPTNYNQYAGNYMNFTQLGQRSPQRNENVYEKSSERSPYNNDIIIDARIQNRNRLSPGRKSAGEIMIDLKKTDRRGEPEEYRRTEPFDSSPIEGRDNEEGEKPIQTSYEKDGPETRGQGVRKYMRHMTSAFAPLNTQGNLVNKDQVVMEPVAKQSNYEQFRDRQKVIQKMNKLSHVLLSTKNPETKNRSAIAEEENSPSFERNTMKSDYETSKKFAASRSPQNSMFRATIALISTKAQNCEDREIKRSNRYEVGGVVDLAHNIKTSKQYEVKKFTRGPMKRTNVQPKFTQKDRQKASKVIQGWWRDVLNKYNTSVSKIVLLQSVWRGFFFRDHLYEYLYMLTLVNIFNDKIRNATVLNHYGKFFSIMKQNYLPKILAAKKSMAVFKIKRQARKFLTVLRNKKVKLPLLIEKLAFKNRNKTFNDVRKFGEDSNKNKEKNLAFLEKLKKILRVNIFHDTLFSIFKQPYQKLSNSVIKYILKRNINKSDNDRLRLWFMAWLKKAIQLKGKDALKYPSTKLLVNSITKPRFKQLATAMKRQIPKALKQKAVKRLIGNTEKYKDIWLKIYFKQWREKLPKIAAREFFEQVRSKFLGNFRRNLNKRVLGDNFRKWKNHWIKSKDMRPIIKGMEHLQNHLRRKAYDQIMPIDTSEGIKSRIISGLFNKVGVFKKIPLRHYLNKWKKIIEKLRRLKISGLFINSLGSRVFKRTILKLLTKRFFDWQRKTAMMKYKDLQVNTNSDHQKVFAISKMVPNLLKHGKKVAFKKIAPELARHFRSQFYGSIAKRITTLMPNLEKTRKRMYWRNYRDQVNKLRQQETRNKFFDFIFKNMNSKLAKRYLRGYLVKWRRNLPKNVDIKYYRGVEQLKVALLRRNIVNPLEALSEKIDLEKAKNGMARSLGIKTKYIMRHWRKYLMKWKKICNDLETKEKENELSGKLLGTIMRNIRKRILSNRFSHWRKVPKINMKDVFDRFRNMNSMVMRAVNYSMKPNKKLLLEKVGKFVGNTTYRKALDQLANLAINGKNIKKKAGLEKWRLKAKDAAIYQLKMKLLKSSLVTRAIKERANKIGSAFNRWKKNVELNKAIFSTHKNWKMVNLGMVLDKMRNRRQNELMTRLKRLMNLDARGRILLALQKRLNKPRNTMCRLFDRWRRINDLTNKQIMIQNMNSALIEKSTKSFFNRLLRDKFVKSFGRWKVACRKPNDYYEKKLDGMNKLNNFIKQKACKQPFNEIDNFKNYRKIFGLILPANLKIQQRNIMNAKLKAWKQWRKVVDNEVLLESYGDLVGKLSKTLKKRREKERLTAAFYKWKNIKKKLVYLPDVIKAEKIIKNYMQKGWICPVVDILYENLQNKRVKSGIFAILSVSKSFQKNKLKVYFKKWFKTSILQDDHIRNTALRSFKRMALEKYVFGPKEKYFRKWLRIMINRPYKKLENAFKVIAFGFRKQNSQHPFNLIKNHRAGDFLRNVINKKVFPNIESFKNRLVKNSAQKWLRNAKAQTAKNFFAKYLARTYDATKKNFIQRLTKKKFDQYRYMKKRIPELRDIIEGENKVFSVFAKKYLAPEFVKNMKKYADNKFLKGLLIKNSKFHRKALEPFFRKWRSNANKIKDDANEKFACLQVISKVRNHNFKSSTNNLLRRKFYQFRDKVREYARKYNDIVPKSDNLLIKGARKKNLPGVLFKLGLNRICKNQKSSLKSLNRTVNSTFMKHQSNAFNRWRNKIGYLRMGEFKNKTISMYLKNLGTKLEKDGLRRAFYKWTGRMFSGPNSMAITVGVAAVKRLFVRPIWKNLFDKTKMMNLKIPHGISFKDALIRQNPHVAKSIAIRNVAIRPYFRRWIKKVDDLKSKELKQNIFNKIFLPVARKNSRLVLRKGLDQWRDKIAQEDLLNLKKGFHSKFLIGMYGKNNKIALRRSMNKWQNVNKDHIRKLNDISLGVVKLKKTKLKHGYNSLVNKLNLLDNDRNIMNKIRKNFNSVLRNTDKGNLEYCMNKWKSQVMKLRERNLKYKLLKFLVGSQENKKIVSTSNRLHEAILKWRIRCAPIDYYDQISKFRLGTHSLHRGLNKLFNREIFDRIKRKAAADKVKELLYKFISDYEKSGLTGLLRNKFKIWRIRVGDTAILKNRFVELVNNYLFNSQVAHNELFKKPTDDLVEAIKARVEFKKSKANSVQKYCRGILNLLEKMKVVKRNIKLHKLFSNLNLKDALKARIYLARWVKKSNILTAHNKAGVIQKFLRGKRDDLNSRRGKLDKAGNLFITYLKRKVLNDLQDKSIKLRVRQLLLRMMADLPDEVKREFLNKHFNRWRNSNVKSKQHEAADKIKSNIKGHFARKFRDLQLKKKSMMNNIAICLFGKYLDKKRIYFNKWALDSKLNRLDTNSKTIQSFLRKKMKSVKDNKAKSDLSHLFKKSCIQNLKSAMDTASKIDPNRGAVLYETLEKIFIRSPFEKLKLAALWIGRIKHLHRCRPKITKALKKHFIPTYLKRWKAKTYDDMVNRLISVQNWFRSRMMLWKLRVQARKDGLLQKYLLKLTNDTDLLKKIALKNWNKKAKISTMNKQAEMLQMAWKGVTSKKNVERLRSQKRLNNLLRRGVIRNLCDDIVKCGDFIRPLKRNLSKVNSKIENRYTTNNLISLANNNIRNLYFKNLSEKLSDKDNKAQLSKYFDRFKLWGISVNNKVKKIQKGLRSNRNKNKDMKLLKRSEMFSRLYLKYENSDLDKKKIFFRRWLNRAKIDKVFTDAITIQKFLRKNLDRVKTNRFQDFFTNTAKKFAKRRILNGAKTDSFKKNLQKNALRVFNERLINKTKRDKISFLFLRRFYSQDEKLKSLYLRRYFMQWRGIANRLKVQENAAAMIVTNSIKMFLAKKQTKLLRDQKERVMKIILMLTNDMGLKASLYFRLWRTISKENKFNVAARVLQDFMRKVKSKSLNLKKISRDNDISDGLDKVDHAWNHAMKNRGLQRIKARSNRNLLKKVGDDIHNKRINHLKSAVDKISETAFWNHQNRTSAANSLQKIFRLYKERQGIWRVITKIRKLRFILSLMGDRNKRILNKAYKLWKRNAKIRTSHLNAETIQDFMRQNVLNYRKNKLQLARGNLKRMLKSHATNRIKDPFKTASMQKKLEKLSNATTLYIKKLVLDKLVEFDKLRLLNKLFKIPKSCALRLQKKWLDIFRRKAREIKNRDAATKLQRRIRTHFVVQRKNDMKERVSRILFRLSCKNDDIRRFNLSLWNRRVKAISANENAKIIQHYVGHHWARILAKKKWIDLSEKLYKKNYFLDGMDAMTRFRQFTRFDKMFNVLDKNMKKGGNDLLMKKMREIRCKHKLILMLTNTNRAIEINTQMFYLRRWRNTANKYKRRDEALVKTEKIFSDNSRLIAAKTIKDAYNMKKLFGLVDVVKNKLAFKKLKTRANNHSKVERFGNCLVEADQDLHDKNKNVLVSKIYRIYIYKILDNALKRLDSYHQNELKQNFAKILFDRMHDKRVGFSNQKSKNQLKSKRPASTKKFGYSSLTENCKKKLSEVVDKNTLPYLIPHLVTFLNNKLNDRLRFSMDKLKGDQTAKKFAKLFTSYVKKRTMPPAFEAINNRSEYNSQTPEILERLRRLFRLSFLKKSKNHLRPVAERCRLFYLVKVTLMHREMVRKRSMAEGFKRWRFLSFMKKLAKKKMEAMYKGMHMNYLKMAMEVFGDDEANPGLVREIESFNDKMGMFTNENPTAYEDFKKKYNTRTVKKYYFQQHDLVRDDEESHLDMSQISSNNPYYYEEDNGDFTHGRYKSEREFKAPSSSYSRNASYKLDMKK